VQSLINDHKPYRNTKPYHAPEVFNSLYIKIHAWHMTVVLGNSIRGWCVSTLYFDPNLHLSWTPGPQSSFMDVWGQKQAYLETPSCWQCIWSLCIEIICSCELPQHSFGESIFDPVSPSLIFSSHCHLSCNWITAATTSFNRSWGIPTTAAASTPGCFTSAVSTWTMNKFLSVSTWLVATDG